MGSRTLLLIFTPSLLATYLVDEFKETIGADEWSRLDALGITARAEDFDRIRQLHGSLGGATNSAKVPPEVVCEAYGESSTLSRKLLTIKDLPVTSCLAPDCRSFAITESLISRHSDRALRDATDSSPDCLVFSFVDEIFGASWLNPAIRILNMHPGVLPFARGIGAIEQIAASGDVELFKLSCGYTLHLVDHRIDAGPVLVSELFEDPFQFSDLPELRAHNFLRMFSGAAKAAKRWLNGDQLTFTTLPNATNYRLWRRSERSLALQQRAIASFNDMRTAARDKR